MERGTLPAIKLDEARTALNVAENTLRARTAERAVMQQQFNEGQVLAPAGGPRAERSRSRSAPSCCQAIPWR